MANYPLASLISFRTAASALLMLTLGVVTSGCASQHATQPPTDEGAAEERRPNDVWASTYEPQPVQPTVIRNATIMTAAGETLKNADIFLQEGKIEALGQDLDVPAGAQIVDGSGKYVTPGLIDSHSHVGVSATPEVAANYDNNDVGITTPQLWMEHGVWSQGPGFARALAGGTTTALLLPGSGDLIEGRGVTVKMVPARTAQAMQFPGAPPSLKMACGENPKGGGGFPNTRMGNVAAQREAFIRAQAYRDKWDAWLSNPEGDSPRRDLGLETLAEVLRGNILVQVHCYRADDMRAMMGIAEEFDFDIRSFHHAVEAYKIRDLLAKRGISASMWSDRWGFKMEAFDGIPQNIALVSTAGARAIAHSDSDLKIQLLNQEVARALHAGRAAGLDLTRDEALRWITYNPAWALGIEDKVGTLEPGKNADVVLWTGDPFSVYTKAERVWIDGALLYDRTAPGKQPRSDFELGGPLQEE